MTPPSGGGGPIATTDTTQLRRRAEQRPALAAFLHPLRTFLQHYRWIHTVIGLLGNLAFVIGSVLFLWEATKSVAIWCFIIGSVGMLLGSVGRAIVNYEEPE